MADRQTVEIQRPDPVQDQRIAEAVQIGPLLLRRQLSVPADPFQALHPQAALGLQGKGAVAHLVEVGVRLHLAAPLQVIGDGEKAVFVAVSQVQPPKIGEAVQQHCPLQEILLHSGAALAHRFAHALRDGIQLSVRPAAEIAFLRFLVSVDPICNAAHISSCFSLGGKGFPGRYSCWGALSQFPLAVRRLFIHSTTASSQTGRYSERSRICCTSSSMGTCSLMGFLWLLFHTMQYTATTAITISA